MWETQMIQTERGDFEVFKKGEGPPLCVTHLYSVYNENGNLFANSFTHKYTVYLVNLAGCGNSTAGIGDDKYSMAAAVKDLEAIRVALDFSKWGFVGHSTGGMLGLTYGVQAGASLHQLIVGGLCASNEYMNHPGSIYCAENGHNKRIKEIIQLLREPDRTIEERRAANKEWTMMSVHNEAAYEEMIKRPNSGKTMSARLDYYSYQELPSFDLRADLHKIEGPTHIYAGVYDAQCPHEFGVEAASLITNAKFTSFEGSNHFPFIEEEAAFLAFVNTI